MEVREDGRMTEGIWLQEGGEFLFFPENMTKSELSFDVCDHGYVLLWQHHSCMSENTTLCRRDSKGKEKAYNLILFEFLEIGTNK